MLCYAVARKRNHLRWVYPSISRLPFSRVIDAAKHPDPGFTHEPPAQPNRENKHTIGLQDTEDLVTSDRLDLGDTVRVTENDADLRGRETATGELEDLLGNVLGGGLGPRGLRAAVGEGRSRDTLALAVHAT